MPMKLPEIELLLEKYFNGETTIEEERSLKDFFQKNKIPDTLKPIAMQFGYFSEDSEKVPHPKKLQSLIEDQIIGTQLRKKQKWNRIIQGFSMAAAAILILLSVQIMIHYFKQVPSEVISTHVRLKPCLDKETCFNETRNMLLEIAVTLDSNNMNVEKNNPEIHDE